MVRSTKHDTIENKIFNHTKSIVICKSPNECLPLNTKFIEEYGLDAKRKPVQHLLNGTYCSNIPQNQYESTILKACKRAVPTNEIIPDITQKEFKKIFRNTHETTAS